MAKTPLDVLKEQNRIKRTRQAKGLLAFLEELNEERRQQRQRDRLLDLLRQPLRRKGTLIIGVKRP